MIHTLRDFFGVRPGTYGKNVYPKSIKWVHVRDVMSTKIENRTYETDSIVSMSAMAFARLMKSSTSAVLI